MKNKVRRIVVSTFAVFVMVITGGLAPLSAWAESTPTVTVSPAPRDGGEVTIEGKGFNVVSPGIYVAIAPSTVPKFYGHSDEFFGHKEGSDSTEDPSTMWVATPQDAAMCKAFQQCVLMNPDGSFSIKMPSPAFEENKQWNVLTIRAHGERKDDKNKTTTPLMYEPECEADPNIMVAQSGDLQWSVKKSFLNVLEGVGGGWETSDSASYVENSEEDRFFNWQTTGGTYNVAKHSLNAAYKGTVRLFGVNGLVEVYITDPEIKGNELWASVKSKEMQDSKTSKLVDYGRIQLGRLEFDKPLPDKDTTVVKAKVFIVEGAEKAFGDHYKAANNDQLDMLTTKLVFKPETCKNKAPKMITPAPTDTCVTQVKSEGTLQWAVKDSFQSYIRGVAKGDWTLSEGAAYDEGIKKFTFPALGWAPVAVESNTVLQHGGAVNFTGHQGILDLTFKDPTLRVYDNGKVELVTLASSNDMSGNMANYGRVVIAQGTVATKTVTGKKIEVATNDDIKLTAKGSEVFAGSYPEGELMGPITAVSDKKRITECTPPKTQEDPSTNEEPKPGTSDTEDKQTDNSNTDSGGSSVTDKGQGGNTAKEQVIPPKVKETKTSTVVQAPPTAKCEPIPNKYTVSNGTLTWGVRKSFMDYLRGNIAKGKAVASAGATSNANGAPPFTYSAGTGSYDSANKKATVSFVGTVHFTGHNYGQGPMLDMKISNPGVSVTGTSGTLYANVSSSDMNGKKTNYGRVALANFSAQVSSNGPTMTISGRNVALTTVGAKAFADFYKPGEPMDNFTVKAGMKQMTTCSNNGSAGGSGSLAKTGAGSENTATAALLLVIVGSFVTLLSGRNLKRRTHG